MPRNTNVRLGMQTRRPGLTRFCVVLLAAIGAILMHSKRFSLAIAGSHRHQTFEWMAWAPPADSPLQANLDAYFPHSLPDGAVFPSIRKYLNPLGILPENTIFGESICSDEINHKRESLSTLLGRYFGSGVFPLGGIGGAPFVGKTGFGAFAGHVPHGGNVFILFGPHVGMTPDGKVGKFLRDGQAGGSNTCGALVGGYNMLLNGNRIPEDDLADVEEAWICTKLEPLVKEIESSDNPMATLVKKSYEVIEKEVMTVVNTNFGTGHLILLGGIQINMPEPYEDHFMPLHFSIQSGKKDPVDLLHAFS